MRALRGADLERLAELAGVEGAYSDYFGNETRVADDTKRALLAALGYPAETPAEARATLHDLEEAPWRHVLEPVTVATHGSVIRVTVTLDAQAGAVDWLVTEESGRRHRGSAGFAAVEASARRTVRGRRLERGGVELPLRLPAGYHTLEVAGERSRLIVAPSACYLPPPARRAKRWGLAAQVYGLRSRRNWGIGDFTDLAVLARAAGAAGAATVGVNPLHELDPAHPAECSPYSPSSRLFLNVTYIDVEAVPEFAESEAAGFAASAAVARELADLRAADLIDYERVWRLKKDALERAYAWFRRAHLATESSRGHAFRRFLATSGEALERLGTFEALAERFAAAEESDAGWRTWPVAFHDCTGPDVAAFAAQQRERVEFYAYLQWNAELQLAAVADACAAMPLGLYRDLAVGAEPGGAEAWSDRALLPASVSVGAPPDALNARGQNWNLLPLHPHALRARGYEPFVQLLRANMRHAGALRIDHAMGLARLFWIPRGRPAREGAYVRYPFGELLAVLALESNRNRCLVVGEDLGTVPEGFRERMLEARALSSRLLYFERTPAGAFALPATYPALALASPGTHDLPPLWSFWTGSDVAVRAALNLLPESGSIATELERRRAELAALLDALVAGAGLAPQVALRIRGADAPDPGDLAAAVAASYLFLARSRARVVVASLEDSLGVLEQTNVPGTTREHPNWRRRTPIDVEDLAGDVRFAAFAQILRATRPAGSARSSRRPR